MKRQLAVLAIVCGALASGCGSDSPPIIEPPIDEPTPLTLETPDYFPVMPIPPDNPTTVEGVALGRRLFYDTILSGDSTQACASCHQQEHAFGDPNRFSVGIDGIEGNRQAPQLTNAGWLLTAFWDGRARSLEDQATQPVPNPIEMHLDWPDAVARLELHPTYPDLFKAAFPREPAITRDLVVKAIAQFERTLISADSKYDKWLRGEVELTEIEDEGRKIFSSERGDCFHCHKLDLGATFDFRRIGLDAVPVDQGRYLVTNNPTDNGKFKPPTIRNWAFSAPYMHDGRFNTIEEVLDHYNGGFADVLGVDPLIRARVDSLMRPGEVDTLLAFLHTLNDTSFVTNPEFSNPFE